MVGPIYPLSQTGISPKASISLLHGSWSGPTLGLHRRLRAGCSGPSALSPCSSPPSLMMGCWGFLGGFCCCWSCGGTRNDGHEVGELLPRLARILMGDLWLGSEHDISIPVVAGKGLLEVISPLMGGSEIGLNAASTLGPPSSVDIDDPAVSWPLLFWS